MGRLAPPQVTCSATGPPLLGGSTDARHAGAVPDDGGRHDRELAQERRRLCRGGRHDRGHRDGQGDHFLGPHGRGRLPVEDPGPGRERGARGKARRDPRRGGSREHKGCCSRSGFSRRSRREDDLVFSKLVQPGHNSGRAASYHLEAGRPRRTRHGSGQKMLMGDQIEFLREYVADAIRYLVIVDKEGNTEHIPGPANVWFDPTKHRSIAVKRVIMLDSNEHIVSYLRKDGTITRRVIEGPTVHIPASNEWVHEFKWKAKSALHDDGGTFNVLKTLPDQFEVTIPRLRSLDNAEVSMNVMVFMQLVDVQKLLNSTHDPVTDLKVSITADLTEFVSKCTLDQLKERTHELNDLKMFRQSTQRADQIGYKVSKVTYRGYGFSREIDNMLKQNLVDETKLKIEKETAVKAQDIEDMKASRKVDRDLKWKEAEVTTNKLDLDIERTRADERRASAKATTDDETVHLEKLKALGVDLTQYLVAQRQKPADTEVRITSDEKAPVLHMHVDDRSKK